MILVDFLWKFSMILADFLLPGYFYMKRIQTDPDPKPCFLPHRQCSVQPLKPKGQRRYRQFVKLVTIDLPIGDPGHYFSTNQSCRMATSRPIRLRGLTNLYQWEAGCPVGGGAIYLYSVDVSKDINFHIKWKNKNVHIQGDQLIMAVFSCTLWNQVNWKCSVCCCTRVHWTSHFFQGTRKTRPY